MVNHRRFSVFLVALLVVSCFAVFVPLGSCTVTYSYNAGTDTVTIAGAGSASFTSLVAADVAAGWGQISSDASGTQILCNAKLEIGDGTNTINFSDTGKVITFTYTNTAYGWAMIARNHATITLGTLADAPNKVGSNGCTLIFTDATKQVYLPQWTSGATINLYACNVLAPAQRVYVDVNGNCYDCTFSNGVILENKGTSDIQRVTIVSASVAAFYPSANCTVNDIVINSCPYAVNYYNQLNSYTIKNLVTSSIATKTIQFGGSTYVDQYLLNCMLEAWSFTWIAGQTSKVFRQYEFDLICLNGEITEFVEDANVTLTKNGALIGSWLTNSSGQIPTQTLTYGFYNQTGGNTMYDGAYPFVLTVTHAEWANYTSRFYITEKTKMTISMQDPENISNLTSRNFAYFAAFIALLLGVIIGAYGLKRRH